MAVQFVIRITFLLLLTYGLAEAAPMAKPNCRDRCGNISIPYPFGIGGSCYKEKWFEVVCNETAGIPAKAFLTSIDVELLEIKIGDLTGIDSYSPYEPGIVRVNMPNISSYCRRQLSGGVNMRGSPFYFSSYRNIFISTGCDNIAVMTDPSNEVQNWDKVPVVLEWTASNNFTAAIDPRELRRRNADSYHTNYGVDYYYCREGYEGNPYLKTGCQAAATKVEATRDQKGGSGGKGERRQQRKMGDAEGTEHEKRVAESS
nr:wall-associated receptor kinase-like 8 [Quercus suber]